MNKRRMANRGRDAESRNSEAGANYGRRSGSREHDYGKGHKMTSSHGSHSERNQITGPGPVEGAGEVGGAGPGRAAQRYAGTSPDGMPVAPASGNPPKGMKVYDEE